MLDSIYHMTLKSFNGNLGMKMLRLYSLICHVIMDIIVLGYLIIKPQVVY